MTVSSPRRASGWPLVILAGVVVLAAIAVVMPVVGVFLGQADDAAQSQQDFATYRAQIAARPRLQALLADTNRQEAETEALLPGASTALAAANMQSLVKILVERHGGQVRSAQTLASSYSGGLEEVVVQYELSVPLGGLKAVTYELETKAPYLFLDGVDVRPEMYTGATPAAPDNIHVQWIVHGYRKVIAP